MAFDIERALSRELEEHEDAANVINLVSKQLFRTGNYFFWYFLQRLPVYYVYDANKIAWTDGFAVYVGKKFLELSNDQQLFVVRHELAHIALQHVFQISKKLAKASTPLERNIVKISYNIIQDAVVNGLLIEEDKRAGRAIDYRGFVTPDMVNPVIEGDVVRLGFVNAAEKLIYMINKGEVEVEATDVDGNPVDLSKEGIERLLAKHSTIMVKLTNKKTGVSINVTLALDVEPGRGGGEGEQDEYREGSGGDAGEGRMKLIKKPVAGGRPKTREEIYRLVKEATDFDKFKKHEAQLKGAGAGVYGDELYELADVSAKKPEWEAALASTLTSFISKDALVSWSFVNRRAPYEKPGIRYITYPDIHILLDVSGSMLGGTLERALKRIIYIVENHPGIKVKLYQWSSVAKLPEEIDRRFAEDLRRYRKLPITTGGTEIDPALDMALKYVEKKDVVIILTDGYIYDIDTEAVRQKFEKLVQKAGLVIFGSLGYIPETLPKGVVKIRLED